MLKRFSAVLGALALAAAITLPAYASDGQTTQYATAFTPVFGSQVPYTGRLRLVRYSDGIISGYYIPDGEASYIPITGGTQNGTFWFDIGWHGNVHVQGSVKDGKLVGAASDVSARGAFSQYTFTATPLS